MSVSRWLSAGLAVVVCLLLVATQQQIDERFSSLRAEEPSLYLSSGRLIKRLSLGYDGLLACLYWTRAVQHYGREHLGLQRYHLLGDLLDITTTLDPDLLPAYRYGAVLLASEPPDGPGRADLAINLMQKGIAHRPDLWQFRFDLGFLYFRSLQDYPRAVEAFKQGAEQPGAPAWLQVLATRVATEGGDRQTAMFLWQQLYESTDDPGIRRSALAHLYGLRADMDIEALEGVVDQFRAQAGRNPSSWQELIQAGLLRGIPADPAGHPYVLEAEGGVLLHQESPITTSEKGRPR